MQGTTVAAEKGISYPAEVLQPWGDGELSSSAYYAEVLFRPYLLCKTQTDDYFTPRFSSGKNKVRYQKNLAAKCQGLEAPKDFTLKSALLD